MEISYHICREIATVGETQEDAVPFAMRRRINKKYRVLLYRFKQQNPVGFFLQDTHSASLCRILRESIPLSRDS